MGIEAIPQTLWWAVDDATGLPAVYMVDQSRLPLAGDVLVCVTHEGVCLAISGMAVRGITATRPTAVNLFWGAERIQSLVRDNAGLALADLRQLVIDEALAMAVEDEERNRRIGAFGADLLPDDARVLTHCNAGSLATAYFGTALGVIFTAHEQGKIAGVWVDETRPVLQGARLTAWELKMAGVPFSLITDSMAASVMRAGGVDAVIVGADRIAANGDTANKIGTTSRPRPPRST
jgi:methylthioribose-1-phosphate isomerase